MLLFALVRLEADSIPRIFILKLLKRHPDVQYSVKQSLVVKLMTELGLVAGL